MNNIDLTHLETLLAAATPGPWEITHKVTDCYWAVLNSSGDDLAWDESSSPQMFSLTDTKALVALRNAAPALIARVRELEEWQLTNEDKGVTCHKSVITPITKDDVDGLARLFNRI